MQDGGNRVPFIARWPGTIPAGKVSKEIVDFSDFLPTFCDVSGAKAPGGVDGRSMFKTLKGSSEKHRDWIYMWYSRNGGNKAAKQFTRNQRYKLYGDGSFYDIERDVLEKTPLKAGDLSEAQTRVQVMLQRGIDQYKNKRPAHLGLEKRTAKAAKKDRNAKKKSAK